MQQNFPASMGRGSEVPGLPLKLMSSVASLYLLSSGSSPLAHGGDNMCRRVKRSFVTHGLICNF